MPELIEWSLSDPERLTRRGEIGLRENPYQIETGADWEHLSRQPLSLKTYLSALASFLFVAFGVLVMWVLLLMVMPSHWLTLPYWALRVIVVGCLLSAPVLGIISAWQTLGLARQKRCAEVVLDLEPGMILEPSELDRFAAIVDDSRQC